jgi:hypothetical protein
LLGKYEADDCTERRVVTAKIGVRLDRCVRSQTISERRSRRQQNVSIDNSCRVYGPEDREIIQYPRREAVRARDEVISFALDRQIVDRDCR